MSENWWERSYGWTWSRGCFYVHPFRLSLGLMHRCYWSGTYECFLGLGLLELELRTWRPS